MYKRQVLLVTAKIQDWLSEGRLKKQENECILMKMEEFSVLLEECQMCIRDRTIPHSITPEISPTVSTAVTTNMIRIGRIARASNTSFTGMSFGTANQEASATLDQFSTQALVNSTPSAVMSVVGRKIPMTSETI